MSRSTRRAAVAVVLAFLFAGLTAVTSAPTASGQTADEGGGGLPSSGVTSFEPGVTISPAYAGSLRESGYAATSESNGGVPIGAETVIGPDGRVQVLDTSLNPSGYPARAVGQIELEQNGEPFICTGFLIDANTIVSAGHCAFDPNGIQGDPIESAQFFPGRLSGSNSPYGGCNVDTVDAPIEWRANGSEYADYSVMNLDCDIGATVGWFGLFAIGGLHSGTALEGFSVRVEGYPGDKPFGTQWRMGGLISVSQKKMIFYRMDTFGGQSGSPVFQPNRPACNGPCVAGIHAYGLHPGPGPHATTNHGPRITGSRLSYIRAIADSNNP
jgi:glutamyl endopeptidase